MDVPAVPQHVYRIAGEREAPESIPRARFGSLGLGETSHLQRWVLNNPQILGEDLLVVTREYDGFDRSRKRLDILALDRSGKLVVIELKLDTAGHFADLQAINYAAMISTMDMRRVKELYAEHHGVSQDEADEALRGFLEVDEDLPEIDDQPRIIIAAGGFNGAETTATSM